MPGQEGLPIRRPAADELMPEDVLVHHMAEAGVARRRRAMVRGVEILGLARDVGLVAFDRIGSVDRAAAAAVLGHRRRALRLNGPSFGSNWAAFGTQ